jgi:hypothetical protein
MDYTIYPFEGLGAIRFGMTPQQVREVVGEPKGTFMMSKESKFSTDDYFNLGFHIYYDDEVDLCNGVSIFSPYGEEDPLGLNYIEDPGDCITLNFQGQRLFKKSFRELKTWFQNLGTGIQHSDIGVTFLKFRICISSNYYLFPDGHAEYPPNQVYICSLNEMEMTVRFSADLEYPFEPEISPNLVTISKVN